MRTKYWVEFDGKQNQKIVLLHASYVELERNATEIEVIEHTFRSITETVDNRNGFTKVWPKPPYSQDRLA
jgi:hypothetical protein